MVTTQLTHPLTYDDLLRMPDDRNRYEIINGELLVSPAPSLAHQIVSGRLFRIISAHLDREPLGEVLYAPVDVRLGVNDIVEPDLLFLRRERFETQKSRGAIDGPPDLVVEIISPSSASIDTIRKAALYARAGVPEYWLADPESKTFRLLVLNDGIYRDVEPPEGRFHSTVLAGLVIDPTTLFAGLD